FWYTLRRKTWQPVSTLEKSTGCLRLHPLMLRNEAMATVAEIPTPRKASRAYYAQFMGLSGVLDPPQRRGALPGGRKRRGGPPDRRRPAATGGAGRSGDGDGAVRDRHGPRRGSPYRLYPHGREELAMATAFHPNGTTTGVYADEADDAFDAEVDSLYSWW